MTKKSFFIFSLATATLGAALVPAQAQLAPPSRDDKRAQRRAMLQNMTPEQRVQYFQNQWTQRYNAATPEQKAAMDARRAQMETAMKAQGLDPTNPQSWATFMQNGGGRGAGGNGANNANPEAQMRALMNASGITDKTTQDAIIAFALQRQRERQPLLALARDVATSLRPAATGAMATPVEDTTAPATDEVVTQKFAVYQDALDKDKTLAASELAALDQQISYSTNPRLKAFLSLVGLLNPDALAIGGAAAIFAPAVNPVRPAATQNPAQG